MGKFDKILICTDLDGTLFRNNKTISSENIKAIEYFKSEGGFFTFVTGRMPLFSSHVAEIIKPKRKAVSFKNNTEISAPTITAFMITGNAALKRGSPLKRRFRVT